MTPVGVVVVSVDGMVHSVLTKEPLVMRVQTGPIDPELGRLGDGVPVEKPATRYTCACGITIDAPDEELDDGVRWTQGLLVDCPGC